MQKIKLIAYILIVLGITIPAFAINSALEQGIRYIKLGNTYREAGEFVDAEKYLDIGYDIIQSSKSSNSSYWLAASNEFYAYLYKDIAEEHSDPNNKKYFYSKAAEKMSLALQAYKKIISQKDGSPIPIEKLRNHLAKLSGNQSAASEYYGSSKVYNFDNGKYRDLPSTLPANIENLSMAGNKLRDFPAELVRYKNLKFLNLTDNKIKDIPGNINEMNSLKYLNLSNNKIKELPEAIGGLSNLEVLNLSGNRLKTLTATLVNLKNLKVLYLQDNRLDFDEIKNLIQGMPNTNIIHDEYVREEKQDSFILPGQSE